MQLKHQFHEKKLHNHNWYGREVDGEIETDEGWWSLSYDGINRSAAIRFFRYHGGGGLVAQSGPDILLAKKQTLKNLYFQPKNKRCRFSIALPLQNQKQPEKLLPTDHWQNLKCSKEIVLGDFGYS